MRWYVGGAAEVIQTYPLDGGHEPVELAADSGWVEIGVEFPLEEFVSARASRDR